MCVYIYNISSPPSSPRSQRYASNPVLVKYEIIAKMGRKFFSHFPRERRILNVYASIIDFSIVLRRRGESVRPRL